VSRFILVETASEAEAAAVTDILAIAPGVITVCDHGDGCCCKNCPWDGDHG
jgi:hypothetical protein